MARYTRLEQIKIGQDTFYRLLETEYGDNVRDEMAKKYGVTKGNISTYLNMFKRNVVEPKPSKDELRILDKFYSRKCQKKLIEYNTQKEPFLVKTLLNAKDDKDYLAINDGVNLTTIKNCVSSYAKNHPEEQELVYAKLEKLMLLRNKKIKEKHDERMDENNKARYARIEHVLRGFVDGIDYYPNEIFKKDNMTQGTFKSLIELAYKENNIEIINLYKEYCRQLKIRELDFKNLCEDVYLSIVNGKFKNILDFYRATHVTIKKFKLFMIISNKRGLISGTVMTVINEFLNKFIIGTYEFKSMEEATQNIHYSYNGEELTSEMIINLCAELFEQDIPINQNSIIYLFQEKVNKKVNKR